MRDELRYAYLLEDAIPGVLHIYGPPSEVDLDDEDQLNVDFRLVITDGAEGAGMYGGVRVSANEWSSDWYQDEAKMQAREIPEKWNISMRELLGATLSEECTRGDYLTSSILRKMVEEYKVTAYVAQTSDGIEVTVSFSRKAWVPHQFVVLIPQAGLQGLLLEDDLTDDLWDGFHAELD